jgi:hypothetical protein
MAVHESSIKDKRKQKNKFPNFRETAKSGRTANQKILKLGEIES